jgi:glyoxylase-like metal-dependent hydrolase (beta-lactamase superfamily II)
MASGQSQPPKQSVGALLPLAQYWELGSGNGMWVNNYILIDRHSHQAVVFDTGVDATLVLSSLDAHALNLAAIFITHTHRDHVEALPAIASASGCPLIFSPRGEPLQSGAVGISAGHRQKIGPWSIHAVASAGHSPDGLSYVVEGAKQPLVFVGDALFALSMGGARQAYQKARKEVSENILSLAPNTILCPGHGPLSTVQHELAHNPFF